MMILFSDDYWKKDKNKNKDLCVLEYNQCNVLRKTCSTFENILASTGYVDFNIEYILKKLYINK